MRFTLILMFVLLFALIALLSLLYISEPGHYSCQTDSDCACGVSKDTGDCFYGNRNFVDESKQCPDFCTGIAGNLVIECIDNVCTQRSA